MLKTNQTLNLDDLDRRQAFYNISAGGNTSNIFKSDGVYVDFYINQMKNQLDEIENFTLQFEIANTSSVNTMTLTPSFCFCPTIEFYSNNKLMDIMRLSHLFIYHTFLNSQQTENVGRIEGYIPNDNSSNGGITATNVIPPNSSKFIHLLIPKCVFNTKHLLLPALNGEQKIRVYFNKESNINFAPETPSTLQVVSFQLLANGIKYNNVSDLEQFMNKEFELNTIIHRYDSKNVLLGQALSNNITYNVSLEQLKGEMEFVIFYLVKSGATLADYYQSNTPYDYAMQNFTLFDSDGTNAGFYSSMNGNYIKTVIPLCCQNSLWQALFSFYMLPFSTNPQKSYNNNEFTQMKYLDGKFSLNFQPGLNGINDPISLVYLGHQRAKLNIKDGLMNITQL